ncbi:hypothetical protein BGZ83_003242 [Gryganskiella cystojenkinii]|nr:hypothetical protein BGZ83_003242 [Gryganskiella cystojenkinii]
MYGNGTCCMCRQEPEDNHHLWCCQSTQTAQRIAWSDAIGPVNNQDREAMIMAHNDVKSRHEAHLRRDPDAIPLTLRQWSPIPKTRLWESFDGMDVVSPAPLAPSLPLPGRRLVADVYMGWLPVVLVQS